MPILDPHCLRAESLNYIVNGKRGCFEHICLDGIVEISVPLRGNAGLADNGADNTARSCGRAVVIQTHGYGFSDDPAEIRPANGQPKDGQTGIVQSVHSVHAGEFLIHRLPRMMVVSDAGCLIQRH